MVSGALSHQPEPPSPSTPTTSQLPPTSPLYIPPNQTWSSSAAYNGIPNETIQPGPRNSAYPTDQSYTPSSQNWNPTAGTEEPYRSFNDSYQILPAYNDSIDGSTNPGHAVRNSYNSFGGSGDQYPLHQQDKTSLDWNHTKANGTYGTTNPGNDNGHQTPGYQFPSQPQPSSVPPNQTWISHTVNDSNAYRLDNTGYQESGYQSPSYPNQLPQLGPTSNIPSQNSNSTTIYNGNTYNSLSNSPEYHPGNLHPRHLPDQPFNVQRNQKMYYTTAYDDNYTTAYDDETYILNSNTSGNQDKIGYYPENDYPLYQKETGHYPGYPSYRPGHPFYVQPDQSRINPSTKDDNVYRPPPNLAGYYSPGNNYPSNQPEHESNVSPDRNWIKPAINDDNVYRPPPNPAGYYSPYPSNQPEQVSNVPSDRNWINPAINDDNVYRPPLNSAGYYSPYPYPSNQPGQADHRPPPNLAGYYSPGNNYPSNQPEYESNVSPDRNWINPAINDDNVYRPPPNLAGYYSPYPSNQPEQASNVPSDRNWIKPAFNDDNTYPPPPYWPGYYNPRNTYPSNQPGHESNVSPDRNWINPSTKDENVYRPPPNPAGYYSPYPSNQPEQASNVPSDRNWIKPAFNDDNTYPPPPYWPGYYNPRNTYPSNQPGQPPNVPNPSVNNGNNYQPPPNTPEYCNPGNNYPPIPNNIPQNQIYYPSNQYSQPGRPCIPSQGNNCNGIRPPAPWQGASQGVPSSGYPDPAARPGTMSQPVPKFGDIHAPSFQWHVGMYAKTFTPYMQICGGSLVKADVVLSAAHCFWNDDVGLLRPALFAVAAGKLLRPWEIDVDSQAQRSDVKDIKIPSRFQGGKTSFQDDIAVVMMVSPFEYAPGVKPVCVSFDLELDRRQLVEFNLGTIAGWGLTQPNGQPSQRLNFLKLPYVTIDRCVGSAEPSFLRYITSDKICAGDQRTGRALCRGDSGGGLIFYEDTIPYIRGIASTAPRDGAGNECNAYAIASFTHVRAHRTFLVDHVPDIAEGCEALYSNGTSGATVQLLQSGTQGSPNKNVTSNTDVLEQGKKDKFDIGKNKTETVDQKEKEQMPERKLESNRPNLQSVDKDFQNVTTGDRTLQSQVIPTSQRTTSRQDTLATIATIKTTATSDTIVTNGTVSKVTTSWNKQTKLVTMSVGRGERGVVTGPVDGASMFVCDCSCRN